MTDDEIDDLKGSELIAAVRRMYDQELTLEIALALGELSGWRCSIWDSFVEQGVLSVLYSVPLARGWVDVGADVYRPEFKTRAEAISTAIGRAYLKGMARKLAEVTQLTFV
jgi:hypothetical protein